MAFRSFVFVVAVCGVYGMQFQDFQFVGVNATTKQPTPKYCCDRDCKPEGDGVHMCAGYCNDDCWWEHDRDPDDTTQYWVSEAWKPTRFMVSIGTQCCDWTDQFSFHAFDSHLRQNDAQEYYVSQAWKPTRFRIDASPQCCGWTDVFSFWAFNSASARSGTTRYYVSEALKPTRYRVSTSPACCGWKDKFSFWAYDQPQFGKRHIPPSLPCGSWCRNYPCVGRNCVCAESSCSGCDGCPKSNAVKACDLDECIAIGKYSIWRAKCYLPECHSCEECGGTTPGVNR